MRYLISLLFIPCLLIGSERPDVPDLIRELDRLFRSDDSQVVMEMEVQTPDWQRTMRMDAWSRGLEETFIVIQSPKKDRGISTLRRQEEMWNYFPKVDRVIKVPPSLMKSSWMGSDFTNDDLVKETSLLRDYDADWAEENDPGFWLIDLRPKEATVTVWARIRIKVDATSRLPVEERYYDERGELIRILSFGEVKELGGRTLPTRLEMTPQGDEKRRTIVRYLEARFDQGVEDEVFSLRNLQKRR